MWADRSGHIYYGYNMQTPPTPEETRELGFRRSQLASSWSPSQRPPTRGELQTIVNAVRNVAQGNPDLLAKYFDYYTQHRIRMSTAQLGSLGSTAHGAETHGGGETVLAPNWRTGLSPGGIGAMLLHEFIHTGGPASADELRDRA
jgi:hypothetical protein